MKKHIASETQQPTHFAFTEENIDKAKNELTHYPKGQEASAVMKLLTLAQQQSNGWISNVAISYIATFLKLTPIAVYEVASFYSMYNLAPVGKYLVQVCRTTPCWLCKSEDILSACKDFLKISVGETTADNLFTLIEVECLGACVDAPVVQINEQYYEKLDKDKVINILSTLKTKM